MPVTILPYERLPSEADVAAFEAEFGYTLPDSYRAFLLTNNGGDFPDFQAAFDEEKTLCFPGEPIDPSLADLDFYAPGNFWDVALFHGLLREPGHYGDLADIYRSFRHDSPPELLPIASQLGNMKYFLCLDGPRRGEILFTSWETQRKYDAEEPITQADYICVAKSFEAMGEGLDYRKIEVD